MANEEQELVKGIVRSVDKKLDWEAISTQDQGLRVTLRLPAGESSIDVSRAQLDAALDGVTELRGAERDALRAKQMKEAEELLEAALLWMHRGFTAQVPLADQGGGVAGPLEPVGERGLGRHGAGGGDVPGRCQCRCHQDRRNHRNADRIRPAPSLPVLPIGWRAYLSYFGCTLLGARVWIVSHGGFP